MHTLQLVRFLLPLALTTIIAGLSSQVINGGMARMPQATQTLAAFGLAWGLVMLLSSPVVQIKQVGLVLVDGRRSYRTVLSFVALSGFLLAAVLALLAFGRPGQWVIEDLHGVSQQLGRQVRLALAWFIPVPILRGMALFYAGLLLRVRRTELVSISMLASITASIVAVLTLLPAAFIRETPLLLPIVANYAAILVELLVVFWGYRRYVRQSLPATSQSLTLMHVLRFFWPLAFIMVIQGLSRPLINLFVSRETGGAEALAILTVVYPLAHIFYGWLNEIRNLPAAFSKKERSFKSIPRFALACGLFSFVSMLIFLWTPLRQYILLTLIGVDATLAEQARIPLIIFSFFPLSVMVRAYLHGVGLLQRATKVMAPSAPARLLAILTMLLLLPVFSVNGAVRGVAALLAGFLLETVAVWWGLRSRVRPLTTSNAWFPN